MKLRIAIAAFTLGLAVSVMPVAAHHSVRATFDISKEITIRGPITRIEWLNPHARIWVDTRNENGVVENWEVELAPPNTLKRTLGLDFIKVGDQVNVVVWRAKDGSRLANVLDLTLPDGRTILHSNRNSGNGWDGAPSPR